MLNSDRLFRSFIASNDTVTRENNNKSINSSGLPLENIFTVIM